MELLLRRLRDVVEERGKKAELARFLGVPMPRVSEWLSGERYPRAEITLALLEWVQAEEKAQQKKGSDHVAARPEPNKAQKRKRQNEKHQSKSRPPQK
jgi:transcriptional regulator with XRE-family HTH domain